MPLLFAIPYLSLIGAFILAFWPRFVAAKEMARLPGGYNNSNPRAQQTQLDGLGCRALNAHYNGMEALPMFGIGVLAAMQRHIDIRVVVVLCAAFLIARFIFVRAYLQDQPSLRSAMFTVGLIVCIVLCALAAYGGPRWP